VCAFYLQDWRPGTADAPIGGEAHPLFERAGVREGGKRRRGENICITVLKYGFKTGDLNQLKGESGEYR